VEEASKARIAKDEVRAATLLTDANTYEEHTDQEAGEAIARAHVERAGTDSERSR
jgi:hypothetical protein